MIGEVMGTRYFSTTYHLLEVKEGRGYRKKYTDDANWGIFLHTKHAVSYLSIRGTTVNGTVLSATKFCDFKCAPCNVNPFNLQRKYNGCLQTLSVRHVLIYSREVLVIVCHNNICDEIIHLARQSFSSNHVHGKTLINNIRSRSEREVCHRRRVNRNTGWHVNQKPMLEPDLCHHRRQIRR